MLYKIIQDEINVNNIMQEYYTNLINRLPKGSIIVNNNNWDNDYALNRFLTSNIYSTLEKEETKVWHLSSYMLAQLFKMKEKDI